MALSHPVKLVLKSTTTQTLSDRFTEMMRNKSVNGGGNRQKAREESITQTRASAKNRRLAEQMSHRRDAVMDQFENEEPDIKSRLDQSKIKTNVKERLGRSTNFNNGNIQNRLGGTRGRGRGRGSTPRAFQGDRSTNFQSNRSRGGSRGTTRASFQQRGGRFAARGRGSGRGGNRGANRGSPRSRSRGRGRGGRGRGDKSFVDRGDLDTELDSYMNHT